MSTILFAMPLKKEKTENYKAFLNECLGPRLEGKGSISIS